ncbi:MAG: hypothetical protein JNK85_25715 [Verrucomicrobiales bacterium]|nr:hypothetical protein [Verrucomicrobiales bacterium]
MNNLEVLLLTYLFQAFDAASLWVVHHWLFIGAVLSSAAITLLIVTIRVLYTEPDPTLDLPSSRYRESSFVKLACAPSRRSRPKPSPAHGNSHPGG